MFIANSDKKKLEVCLIADQLHIFELKLGPPCENEYCAIVAAQ